MTASIIIPCYNGARFLPPLLTAIAAQTRPADEVIVVDDGSADGSAEIAGTFPNVTVIRNPTNQGLAHTRNKGIEAARGEILIFADVDAYPDPEMVAALLKEYADPDVGGAGGAGIESNIRTLADRWRKYHASQNSGDRFVANAGMLWGLCSSYRKDALAQMGGFDPFFLRSGEDIDMSMRFVKAGYRLVYTPRAKVYHQRTDTVFSLFAMMHRWYFWGYLAHKKNRGRAARYYMKTIAKSLLRELSFDLFQARSPRLALLSLGMFATRLSATAQAMRAAARLPESVR